jgi:DNA-binding response OmpR family regulator
MTILQLPGGGDLSDISSRIYWPLIHRRQNPGAVARILIAESEERIASFLEKGLRAHGFVPAVTADGMEALRLARSGTFSLLVVDLNLPDATAVVQELSATGPPLPILILAPRPRSADAVLGHRAGEHDYVTKPFGFDELLARIHAKLRGRLAPLPSHGRQDGGRRPGHR